MTDEKEKMKFLADKFFQNENYTDNSNGGLYKQANLELTIPLINESSTKVVVGAYNIAYERIREVVDRTFNALFYLGKNKDFNLSEYLDSEIPRIYIYMDRIYQIRNILLAANTRNITISQKKKNINRLFGEFDDIFFLEDEICKFIPEEKRKDEKIVNLLKYVEKEYIKYANQKDEQKTR